MMLALQTQSPLGAGMLGSMLHGAWSVVVAFWDILVEAGPWLLVGFAIAGVMHAVVPRSWLTKQFGSRGIGSVLRAAAVGVPLPLCSCSVIPAAAGLRRGGASKGAAAAFAISTPEVDIPAASLTWALIGWPIAVARVVAALISGIAAGIAIDLFDRKEAGKDKAEPNSSEPNCSEPNNAEPTSEVAASCCHTPELATKPSCCSTKQAMPAKKSLAARAKEAIRYGYIDMPADLARWMVIGLVLSAMVAALVPEDLLERVGTGWPAMLAMLVIGVPFYVCATASTPLAAVLIAKGLDPGAALVFLLAGPATNPATMAWVLKDLGGRSLVIYLGSISAVSLGAGALVNAMGIGAILSDVGHAAHDHGAGVFALVSGGLLALVLGVGLVSDLRATLQKRAILRASAKPVQVTLSVDR